MTFVTYHSVDSSAVTTAVVRIGIRSRIRIRRFDFEASLEGLDFVLSCKALATHEDVAVLREVTGVRCFIAQFIFWFSF